MRRLELVSGLVYDFGAKELIIEDSDGPSFNDKQPVSGRAFDNLSEHKDHAVTGYGPAEVKTAAYFETLRAGLSMLKKRKEIKSKIFFRETDEEDRARQSRQKPVNPGSQYVAESFHSSDSGSATAWRRNAPSRPHDRQKRLLRASENF